MKNYSTNKQTIANRKWQEKNKEKSRYLEKRSKSKSFIKEASLDDLQELKSLIYYEIDHEIAIFMNQYRYLIDYATDGLLSNMISREHPLKQIVKEKENDIDYN